MEVLLPGESGPVLKCALPDLPHEVRMKLITEITAQVPTWQTQRLERADSGTRLGMEVTRRQYIKC